MFSRLLLLLTLLLGLATGPVGRAGDCAAQVAGMKCERCCAVPDADCCAKGGAPAPKVLQVATTSPDLKQAIAPVIVCLGLPPTMFPARVFARVQSPVLQPARSRVDVTCIRLI